MTPDRVIGQIELSRDFNPGEIFARLQFAVGLSRNKQILAYQTSGGEPITSSKGMKMVVTDERGKNLTRIDLEVIDGSWRVSLDNNPYGERVADAVKEVFGVPAMEMENVHGEDLRITFTY